MTLKSTQKLANKIDLEIYRLLRRAEDAALESAGSTRERWTQAKFYLAEARLNVRALMSDDDRKSTI